MTSTMHADLLADLRETPHNCYMLFEFDLDGITRKYSHVWGATSTGLYKGYIIDSGTITRGVSDNNFSLPSDSATVNISDPDRELEQILMGDSAGSVTSSAARIILASTVLTQDKWFSAFVGIIDSFSLTSPLNWELSLKRDDLSLQGLVNIPTIEQYDWINLPTLSIGLSAPVVYGKHDSGQTSILGMLEAIYVDDVSFRYVASFGPMTSIGDVYSNGTLKTLTTHYTVDTSFFAGGKYWTIIDFVSDQADAIITFDGEGIDNNGAGVITNPATQLEHILTNFIFGDWSASTSSFSSSDWLLASDYNIDETYFAEAEDYLTDKQINNGSRVIYAGRKGIDILNEWTKEMQIPAFWTYGGKIAIRPDDHTLTNTYIDDPFLKQDLSPEPNSLSVEFNTDKLLNEIIIDYLYSDSAEAFQRVLTVKDSSKNYNKKESLQLHWRESKL